MLARSVAIVFLAVAQLAAQPGTITTIIGAYPMGDGQPAPRSSLTQILGLALDSLGRLYISESSRVRRIEADGRVSTIIGNGVFEVPPSAPPRQWQKGAPTGAHFLALGPAGEVYSSINYVSCSPVGNGAAMIWKFEPVEGIFHSVLRSDPCGSRIRGDGGLASAAYAGYLSSLLADGAGRLYFSEGASNQVRRIDPDGTIQLVAGTGAPSNDGDGGPAAKAGLRLPQGLSVSADGNLFIADFGNGKIRKVSPEGVISTFAAMSNVRYVLVSKAGGVLASDGFAIRRYALSGESFEQIYSASAKGRRFMTSMIEDRDGSILVADDFQILRLNAGGSDAGLVAGVEGDAGKSGPPEFAKVIAPTRVRTGSNGDLWFQDNLGVRKRSETGGIETVTTGATSFAVSSDNIVYVLMPNRLDRVVDGRRSVFVAPDKFESNDLQDIVVNSAGDVIVADRQNHRILKIGPTGDVRVIAGTGKPGNTGDGGMATEAQINAPGALAAGPGDSLYINAQGGIRKIDSDGIISTLTSGTNACAVPDFVLASKVGNCPWTNLAVDSKGDVFLLYAQRIHRLRGDNVTRIAGGNNRGNVGDGGAATNALMQSPRGLSVTANGDLIIADTSNHRIRRIQGFSPFSFSDDSIAFAGSLGGPPLEESVSVTSADGESHKFSVRIAYPAGRTGWLTVTPAQGEVTQGSPVTLRLTANLQGLPKGVYSARVVVTDTQSLEYTELPVSLLVSGTPQQLRLSRTGFTFVAVQAGPTPPAQTLAVQNSGRGILPFTVATSTLSGGDWLSASPLSGAADATTQPLLTVRANPGALAPGVYFGLVTVNSTVADNAPQSAVVLMQVLATGQAPAPIVDPAGLIFTSNTPQSITLGNVRTAASNYTIAAPNFPDKQTWFQLPAAALTGTILPGQTAQIQIRPVIDGIKPGQYRAQLSIRFAPDNVTRVVELLLVIANNSAADPKLRAAGSCKPTKLLPIFQQPGGGFAATAGWPQLVQLRVVDDCQDPQVKGRVRVTFNNGDPALTLTPQADGVWAGTWSPGRVAAKIDLSARAESFDPDLAGTQAATGGLRDDANRPRIVPGGVFSEASLKKGDPVAVGSNITVQGVRMASGAAAATTTPLPSRLGETTVLVAGKALGLTTAAEGEIKGLIPFTVADATVQQMIVQRGSSYSLPEPVLIAPVQPVVYSVDGTGRGQGEIYVADEDRQVLADASRPAVGGESVTIIATGLGAVDPKVADGAAGAADPVSSVLASLRVQIQGKEAIVKSATLVPGKPGRYQIVATVPQDVAPDSSARVVLTLADQAVSAPVTMSVTTAVQP